MAAKKRMKRKKTTTAKKKLAKSASRGGRLLYRFIDSGGNFSANQVKVVTEGSVLYLLGLVNHKEADAAVEIARTTGGVQKVVRVFEYIEAPAK